jgi:hypothetical protein
MPTTAFSAPAGFPSRPANSQCKLDHLTSKEKHRFLKVKPETESMLFRLNKLAGVCNERVSELKVVRKLGQGTFGLVLLCDGMFKGRKISVAVKEMHAGSIGIQTHEEVDKEAKLALRMSRRGAGPTVYDLFYASLSVGHLEATFQYVFMEPFDYSVHQALGMESVFGVSKAEFIAAVVPEMLAALRRHLEAGVKCYDVKPGNFVVRLAPDTKADRLKVDVKMIDFGFPHCDITREKNCSRTNCKGLDSSTEVLFVLLSAQVLFMAREKSNMINNVMKAAEKDYDWNRRVGLVQAAMDEFAKNRMLSATYNWYKNGRHGAPTGDSQRKVLKQVLADMWLEKEDIKWASSSLINSTTAEKTRKRSVTEKARKSITSRPASRPAKKQAATRSLKRKTVVAKNFVNLASSTVPSRLTILYSRTRPPSHWN